MEHQKFVKVVGGAHHLLAIFRTRNGACRGRGEEGSMAGPPQTCAT